MVFRDVWGRYAGLIVQGLIEKKVFQIAFFCHIVVRSLGKIFWQCPCFLPCPSVSRSAILDTNDVFANLLEGSSTMD